jgi:hypothetical protein
MTSAQDDSKDVSAYADQMWATYVASALREMVCFLPEGKAQEEFVEKLGSSTVRFKLANLVESLDDFRTENARLQKRLLNVVPFQAHDEVQQHVLDLEAELQRKEATLQAQLKRERVSADIIKTLREELLKQSKLPKEEANAVEMFQATVPTSVTARTRDAAAQTSESLPVLIASACTERVPTRTAEFQALPAHASTDSAASSAALPPQPATEVGTSNAASATVTDVVQAPSVPSSTSGSVRTASSICTAVSSATMLALRPLASSAGTHKSHAPVSHKSLANSRHNTCTFCKRTGHPADKCWDRNATPCISLAAKAQTRPAKSAICSFCSRRGHVAPKCWDKFPSLKPAHVVLAKAKASSPTPSVVTLIRSATTIALQSPTVVSVLPEGPPQNKPSGPGKQSSHSVYPRVNQFQASTRKKRVCRKPSKLQC